MEDKEGFSIDEENQTLLNNNLTARPCMVPRNVHRESFIPDVVLLVGEDFQEVHAVKILLAKHSPLLKYIFLHDPNRTKLVVPAQFKVDAIDGLVRYTLGKRHTVKTRDLLNMRAASKYYMINDLYKSLGLKIRSKMETEKYFCWVFHSACKAMNYGLVLECLEVFENKLDQHKAMLSRYFDYLDYEPDMCLIFKFSTVRVDIDDILKRLKVWAEYAGERLSDRSQQLTKVIELVLFNKLKSIENISGCHKTNVTPGLDERRAGVISIFAELNKPMVLDDSCGLRMKRTDECATSLLGRMFDQII